jgi:hypothetical protein
MLDLLEIQRERERERERAFELQLYLTLLPREGKKNHHSNSTLNYKVKPHSVGYEFLRSQTPR